MRNFKFFIAAILILVLFSGCNKEKPSDKNNSTPVPENTSGKTGKMEESEFQEQTLKKDSKNDAGINMLTTTLKEKEIDVSKRMVVKSGTLSLEVENFDESEKRVSEIAKNQSGFIANSNSAVNASGKKSGTIVIKVPVDKYDALINEISAAGKVATKNITSSDVTEEYIDLESRAKTQKELEQRLLKLLSEKTARLVDIVEVEEKLAAVRQKIESIEGKMKLLTTQASYSTLAVSIFEPTLLQTSSGGGFFYELGQGIKKGLNGMTQILSGLLAIIIALLPVIVFVALVIWIILKIVRRKAHAKA
jgi:hypothetical protein